MSLPSTHPRPHARSHLHPLARPPPHPVLVARAMVRSSVRVRVLLALLEHGELYAAQLVVAARTTHENLQGALFGGDAYRADCALVVLGFVEPRESALLGRTFRLTGEGRALAARLRAAPSRRFFGSVRAVSSSEPS